MQFFVEVGSCDFDTCEKLIKNDWDGIVIEPVKHYYDKLIVNQLLLESSLI